MSQSREFSLVLPSDASKDRHPNNSNSEFVVELPREISLDTSQRDWYVALQQVYLPKTHIRKTSWKGSIIAHPTQTTAP